MQLARLLGIVLAAALVSCVGRQPEPAAPPLLILVSFDGFRWDYHTRAPAPHLSRLMERGVRAEGLIPGHPAKTIPSHYSIVTGLYPGHHGMVGNILRDPATGRLFERTNPAARADPMWWGGDPIWNVVQRAGGRAAIMFWAGAEAPIGGMRPRFWREFDAAVAGPARVDQVLEWLELPAAERPTFVALYLDETDIMGHRYGPDSSQVREAIAAVDGHLGRLVAGLDRLGLLARTNLVVVSDHGMAATRQDRTIVVDDYLDAAAGFVVDINPTLGVVPAAGREEEVYRTLRDAHANLSIYRRSETPEHWRLRHQPRVPPITGVADEGWVVIRRADAATYWEWGPTGGQHGYDPRLESMRGFFAAAGPAFRSGVTVPAFDNVDVHHILSRAMGLPPGRNDGDAAVAERVLR